MKPLIAGANLPLSATDAILKFHYQVEQGEIDLSAYLLAESTGKVRGDGDMLFFGQRYTENGAVTLDIGENRSILRIDTQNIDSEIKKIAVCATIDGAENLSGLENLQFILKSGGKEIASATEEKKNRSEAALILAEIYKHNDIWKCRWVMQGFNGGLRVLAEYFGVEIADEEESVESHHQTSPVAENKAQNLATTEKQQEGLDSHNGETPTSKSNDIPSVGENKAQNLATTETQQERLDLHNGETPTSKSDDIPSVGENKAQNLTTTETQQERLDSHNGETPTSKSDDIPSVGENKAQNLTTTETQQERLDSYNGETTTSKSDEIPSVEENKEQETPLIEKTLSRKESNLRVYHQGKDFGQIKINLNWELSPNRKAGFLSNLLGIGTIDLDLGAMVRLKDGSSYVVQALGNQCGSRYNPPFLELQGDDRTGEREDGEWLFLNGSHWQEIELVVIFCFVYRGKEWPKTTISIDIPHHGEIKIPLGEYDQNLGLCGVVELRNQSDDINIQRIMKYFFDHKKLDQHYGFGIEWTRKQK